MSRTVLATALLVALLVAAGCSGAAAPTGVPLRFATPTPTAAPTERMVGAFVTNFAEAAPPLHAKGVAVGKSTTGSRDWYIRETIEYDARGKEMRGRVSADAVAGDPTVVEIATVDGLAYSRPVPGRWNQVASFWHIQPIDPFATLDPWDLEYVSQFSRDGRTLHRLRTTTWVGDDLERSEIQDARIESTSFSVTVDERGLPVDAELDFVVTGTESGRDVSREYRSTYEFSAIGKPVEIAKPQVQPQPTPTASPKATAAPNGKVGDRIVRSFVSGFVTKDPPIHASGRLVIDSDFTDFGVKLAIDFEMDIDGDDYRATMRFNPFGESKMTYEAIRLDGIMYVRVAGGAWTEAESTEQAQPPSPFATLSPDGIEYRGTVRRSGRTLHRLVATGWDELPNGQLLLADAKVAASSFSIFVDDEGRPVAADLALTITGAYGTSRQPTELKYDASYTFTAIGKPIRIVRPKTGDTPTARTIPSASAARAA